MTGQIVIRYIKIAALLAAGWLIALVLFQTVGKQFIEVVSGNPSRNAREFFPDFRGIAVPQGF